MDQLFLLEILVDTIFFNSADQILPKKMINIVARVGNFASLEIRNDGLGGVEETSKSADLDFNSGKSYLFPCDADTLLDVLKHYPIEMVVTSKRTGAPIGILTVNWTEDFVDMVSSCHGNYGYITPVSHRDIYKMTDGAARETGHVEVFVRLSCFGKNIQTQFQVVHSKDTRDGGPKTQFLFKSNNAATTFQCQRFGMGTSADAIPVAPMYNTIELEDRSLKPVFQSTRDETDGSEQSVFNLEQSSNSYRPKGGGYTDDIMSIVERLEDNKFINLDQLKLSGMSSLFQRRFSLPGEELSATKLTPENITKYLCKHKDCPAARKFQELGLGPLAKSKGLGTLYGDVDPPVTYALSHANGTMENYGPYGVYRKPKRADQPYEPHKLESGSSSKASKGVSTTSGSKKSSCGSCQQVLRLNGGGPIEDYNKISPLHACKGLMDDFDKLLDDYKRALGPCGQAICPYATNLIVEQCHRFCPMSATGYPVTMGEDGSNKTSEIAQPTIKDNADANSVSSCGMQNCPYAREIYQPVDEEQKKSQPMPACGDASCPYTKHLLGIVDEETDDAMRLLSNHPQGCTPPPTLPPIHWDCPDPLPSGRCINSNCPINKMQDMSKRMFENRSVCGGPACPYAMPPPCSYPTCPFAQVPPCMMGMTDMNICQDPHCPLNKMSSLSMCKDPNCPLSQQAEECKMTEDDSVCDDPECPYRDSGAGDAAGGEQTDPSIGGEDIYDGVEYVVGDNIEPCTLNSCKSHGGELICTECPCSGQPEMVASNKPRKMKGGSQSAPIIPKKKSTKGSVTRHITSNYTKSGTATAVSTKPKRKRKRKSKFVYDSGDTYPGVKIGHRECITPSLNVPHNMGWLWNVKPLGISKPRRGWKPGALTKTMQEIIDKHRAELGIKPLAVGPTPKPSKKKLRKNAYGVYETDSDPDISPKSTLQIKKKDGCYLITMNPLKDPNTLEDNENPYMNCTPMQFKITKNRPPMQMQHGDEGEESCMCSCDESSSSDSELDIEFTPPAGIIHPDKLKRKRNVVHADTQYCVEDLPKSDNIQVTKSGSKKGSKKGGKKAGGGKKKGKKK